MSPLFRLLSASLSVLMVSVESAQYSAVKVNSGRILGGIARRGKGYLDEHRIVI